MFYKYPLLFQDPCIDYPIDNLDLNFSDYITKSKKIIKEYRPHLNQQAEFIIDTNAPFELKPDEGTDSTKNSSPLKYGALLIHGLFDTPFIMRDIGKQLQSQGMLVRSILLPGHGTVPGSLLHVTYEDWLQAVRYGIASLKKEVEKIFLVGFSTGASLSVYQTLLDPSQIAGLILVAPAFKINSSIDFTSNWHKPMSWAWPRAQWFYIGKEIDYTKYSSVPFNAIYQVYRLTRAIKDMDYSKEPPCPILMAISYEDNIVCSKTTLGYFQKYSNPENKMVLYSSKPIKNIDKRIILRSSIYPEWNIANFSHVSLPIAPDNSHYGKQGDYPHASRVDEKNSNVVYCKIDRFEKHFYHFLYQMKMVPYQKQRLTFNPDFDFMMNETNKFIQCSIANSI